MRLHFVLSITLSLGTSVAPALYAQQLRINEFMASNTSTIADPDYHDYADWIELFNPGTMDINLNGYSITDNLTQPRKYVFSTDLIVPAQSYLLVWADDRSVNNHTNFKLSASGEKIGLYDRNGTIIDTLSFGAQLSDISFGRLPDGNSTWHSFSPASPGGPNQAAHIWNGLAPPVLSQASGFFQNPVTLTISHADPDASLYYTLDGSTPSTGAMRYTAPIRIDSTIAVRVRAFKNGHTPSQVLTASYFIQETTTLPVISLVTDPENFFSDTSGIYVEGTNGIIANCSTGPRNWNQDWERPVMLEMFEGDRRSAFLLPAGVKIFGGCARLYPQKSLAFFFRSVYGEGRLNYRLFPSQPIASYNNFVLRSSGQDWWRTMFRDAMAQTVMVQGMNLDLQAYRPSVLFINGRYWGIHNVREKLNEHYVASHHPVDPDNIDLIEFSKGIFSNNGDLVAYNALISFLNTHNLAAQANFDSVAALVDIDNFTNYTIAQIYAANGDWPGANVKLWRERSSTGKWRWMVYDLDFTFGGNSQGQYNTNTLAQATATNGPSWPNPPWSTLMLRKLLENSGFRNEFIQRYAVHLSTTFAKEKVIRVIDSLAAGIASEIPRHKSRWPQSLSIGTPTWAGNIQIMKDFAALRAAASMSHFVSKFSLTGTYTLIVRKRFPEHGKVFMHDVEITRTDSSHVFFRNIPLRIRAEAQPGYRFMRWQGAITSTNPDTTVIISNDGVLSAMFEPDVVSVREGSIPNESFQLLENYPNPFNPVTTIRYSLPYETAVRLVIYSVMGEEVRELTTGLHERGDYEAVWDGRDNSGATVSSGVYLYRLQAGGFTKTRRMLLMK